MDGGDLHNYLLNHKVPMDLKIKIMKDITKGMLHLQMEGIVHRGNKKDLIPISFPIYFFLDLAARNVLLTVSLDAKVADFGLSRIIEESNSIYTSTNIG